MIFFSVLHCVSVRHTIPHGLVVLPARTATAVLGQTGRPVGLQPLAVANQLVQSLGGSCEGDQGVYLKNNCCKIAAAVCFSDDDQWEERETREL